jgi:hypothetical protein
LDKNAESNESKDRLYQTYVCTALARFPLSNLESNSRVLSSGDFRLHVTFSGPVRHPFTRDLINCNYIKSKGHKNNFLSQLVSFKRLNYRNKRFTYKTRLWFIHVH